ncbi:MAG: hypothetical protein JAY90_07855 [Candidatus Thiodiazotropha lotti]|nr:hypothetical protein [Candidatus Thiodiazotropha lotti]
MASAYLEGLPVAVAACGFSTSEVDHLILAIGFDQQPVVLIALKVIQIAVVFLSQQFYDCTFKLP